MGGVAGIGGGVAAACLTVLSLWRWQAGEPGWALALLALAFVQLAVAARRTSMRGAGPDRARPTGADVDHARRHRPGWRAIGVAGMVGALVATPFVPPVALVLAGLGVYATWRARSYGRLLATAR